MSLRPTILWLRNDLRLDDHPALRWAMDRGGPVIPVFIWSPDEEGEWAPGSASRVWLHDSLAALDERLRTVGSRLILRRGTALKELRDIADATDAEAVCWARRYEPTVIKRDTDVKKALKDAGIDVQSFNGSLLHEPWEIKNKSGEPYQVFTPFWNACLHEKEPEDTLPAPRKIAAPSKWPRSLKLDELELEPEIDWTGGIRRAWTPGDLGARKKLKAFLEESITNYEDSRDRPDQEGTSQLSPHLHFGEISPRTIWHAVAERATSHGSKASQSSERFLTEIGWREFAHHLLYHFPRTPDQPLREQFAKFPWRRDAKALRAWQRGQTGYPMIDAGMRQLWHTGWMHNRVRMIVASFLVKHLLLPWQQGANWFWDTLVDADLANNTLGWQWSAGCGADAAPYFRIFNPITQGQKFDPNGEYVRQWIPELSKLPEKFIHQPWEAPPDILRSAGVELGESYPKPIVDHAQARERALEALATISK